MVEGVEVRALTPHRWGDLKRLFGPNGASSGCWCMWWRVSAAEFREQAGERLQARLRDLVAEEEVPGLLAYRDGEPVGWVSLGSRGDFPRLERSTKLGRVDEMPVCSIVCFYIHRRHRRQGLAGALLEAAVAEATSRGAPAVEAYPIDTEGGRRPGADLFTGTLDLFLEAGFREVARRGGRPVVRLDLEAPSIRRGDDPGERSTV